MIYRRATGATKDIQGNYTEPVKDGEGVYTEPIASYSQPVRTITADQRKKAIDALGVMIDWFNKLNTAGNTPNANFRTIISAAMNTKPDVQDAFNKWLTEEQNKSLNQGGNGDPKNIQELKVAIPKLISNYTNIQSELKRQVALESIHSPVVSTVQTAAVAAPLVTNPTAIETVKPTPKKDNKAYFIAGGLLVAIIVTFVILKHK